MQYNISYPKEFDALISRLSKKYPQGIFEIEGIGEKLDINKSSKQFFDSDVVADTSVDPSANVIDVNTTSFRVEFSKPLLRLDSLYVLWRQLQKTFSLKEANRIIEEEISGDIYINDLHSIALHMPYCFNFSSLDLLNNGMAYVSKPVVAPPKSLLSFKSQMEQHIAYCSNSILGACGIADLLIGMSWYVTKIFETNYDYHLYIQGRRNQLKYVRELLTSLIYTVNQTFRSGVESPFTNISIYSQGFLDAMCDGIIFPDGTEPNKETIKILQEMFVDIMNSELRRTPITFPVTTANFEVDENHNILDRDFVTQIAKQTTEFGFINIYMGDSATLSSCCRLRSNNKNTYFNSLGAGSSKIGSLGVVTLNLPRLAYKARTEEKFIEKLSVLIEDACKINYVKRNLISKSIAKGLNPLYTKGFMDLTKQYSTVGLNGIYEALIYLGDNIRTATGKELLHRIMTFANDLVSELETKYTQPTNIEQVPSETSSPKLAAKDNILFSGKKGFTSYSLYSNQFIPLTEDVDILERIEIQGEFEHYFSGGAILHLNVENQIRDPKIIEDLIYTCAEKGVVYFAINYWSNYCPNGHVSIGHVDKCPVCGEEVESYTRPVGYLSRVKSFNKARRNEARHRVFK